ncbi:MAG: hypothetical protein IH621_18395 [Krumholzibacteria bacterium]|nr:hypothetical protein [Candidatus Krumholzibacteria bacterium]
MENADLIALRASLGPIDLRVHSENGHYRQISDVNGELWGIVGLNGLLAYRSIVDDLYEAAKSIRANYTVMELEDAVDRVLGDPTSTNLTSSGKFTAAVTKLLPANPIRQFTIWRHIYGLQFSRRRVLGGFTFQQTASLRKRLPSSVRDKIRWDSAFGEHVVSVSVESVSPGRALEIADGHFYGLELLFAMLVGEPRRGLSVRVTRPTEARGTAFVTLSSDNAVRWGYAAEGTELHIVDLSREPFTDRFVRHLFALFAKSQCAGLESRVKTAVIWIGKGTIARTSSEQLVCYCTALEALLVMQDHTFVSPSVVSSLAEYCAYLISSDGPQRRRIDRLVRKVYRARSAVSHHGSESTKRQSVVTARNIAVELTSCVLKLVHQGVSTDDAMKAHIETLKYDRSSRPQSRGRLKTSKRRARNPAAD